MLEVSDKTKKQVLENIREDDLIELSRALIRIPSETGNERECSEFLIGHLQGLGFEARGYEAEPGRPNAVGRWRGIGGGPTLMLSAHLDTVPPGDLSKWITDPYGGEVIDGKIYGRGSMDSKGGGIASAVIAVQAIQRAGLRLRGDVLIVGTVDEEVFGPAGMRYLVGRDILNPDLCLYCVHSDLEIKAYFKGALWTKLTVRGQTAHGSMPHRGINAITRAARFVSALDQRAIPYQKHPVLGDFTRNFGWIHAGPERKYNMVADLCEVGVDMRLVPGQTPQGVFQEIQRLVDELRAADPQFDASLELILADDPAQVAEDAPILQAVRRAGREILGRDVPVGGTIATGDLGPIFRKGKTGVGFGPGDLERGNAHKENEFLEIDQLVAASKIYALVVMETVGLAG
ncbi:MAG: M20 family metallopeptidase [Armatimonadota bacterium]|nr:M20 family metallopeptidase [Armatimonadota bacterium]MDR7551195.1 M20 family metallopeptidase [Armatimonadota bacterium]